MSANEDIRVGFRADSSDVDRALDKTKKKAKETERAVNNATRYRPPIDLNPNAPKFSPETQAELDAAKRRVRERRQTSGGGGTASGIGRAAGGGWAQKLGGGLRAGGLGSLAERVGNISGMSGIGGLGMAAGGIAVAVQGVRKALEFFQQEIDNTAEMLADNVNGLQGTYDRLQKRQKAETDAIATLRELNKIKGGGAGKLGLQNQAVSVLARTYHDLPVEYDGYDIANLDQIEKEVIGRQKQQNLDNIERRMGEIDKQIKLRQEQITGWQASDIIAADQKTAWTNQAGSEIKALSDQRAQLALQRAELRQIDPEKVLRERREKEEAKLQMYATGNLAAMQQELEIQKLINAGKTEEAETMKLIKTLSDSGFDTTSEASKAIIDDFVKKRRELKAAGLEEDFNKELEVQRQALEVQKLINAGKTEEAKRLRLVNDLKRQGVDIESEAAKKYIAESMKNDREASGLSLQKLIDQAKEQQIIQDKRNRGLTEEADKLEFINNLRRQGFDVDSEVGKEKAEDLYRQQRLAKINDFQKSQQERAEELKFQAEQKLRTPEQQAIAAALRAAEAAKKAAGGGSLTKPEREREEQIAKLNYKLNNLPQLNLGDISTKTNALTARGGFASGIVRPQADRVNYQIMTNTQATNRLIQMVLIELQKLGRI